MSSAPTSLGGVGLTMGGVGWGHGKAAKPNLSGPHSGPHSGPQRYNRPEGAFRKHRLTCTLFVGLGRFELPTFGPPDQSG